MDNSIQPDSNESQHPQESEPNQSSEELAKLKNNHLSDLALEFQRSVPGSPEANQNYTRFREGIGVGRYGGLRPQNNSERPLSSNEYHQVSEDSIQDTELRLVSFIRKDFNPEKGDIVSFARRTIKFRYDDRVKEHQGQHRYTENKETQYAQVTSANQPVNKEPDHDDCSKEYQDSFAHQDSVTYHDANQQEVEREELIELIEEDPQQTFSSISMKTHPHITLQKVALLHLREGYNQSEIARQCGVNQSSINRLLERMKKDPLLAKIKEYLDL